MGQGEKPALRRAFSLARGNTNYLSQLLTEHPDITPDVLCGDPNELIDALIKDIDALALSEDIDAIMSDMRRMKRRAHLIIALYDLARIWDWDAATRAITRIADVCLKAALSFAAREHEFPPGDDTPVPGLFAIAVGKYGAFELNYSSDIDFMVFYDPEIITLPETRKPELALIRLVQKTVKILDEINAGGYVFRCDLRLRPDPRSNAVAVSTRSAERYYESLGQNWERAAMIKARVCAGDMRAGQGFINDVLRAFIWRRSLDFAAIADIQAMKRQINSGGGHDTIMAPGHHLKLGRGGIREIEFYAQTQQLILGGRHKALRCIRTDEALMALGQMGFQDAETQTGLIADYGFLRDLEHRVQMMEDAQTHICPQDNAARIRLAGLAGYDDLAAFDAALETVLGRVNAAYDNLYPAAVSLASEAGTLSFTGVESGPDTLETFEKLGFERGPEIWTIVAGWLGGRVPASRTQRARESLTRLAPALIEGCSRSGLPDASFFRFAEFFENLRAGVSILAMFERSPNLLFEAIDLMAQAPRLAQVLSAKPEILDVLIEPDFEQVGATKSAGSAVDDNDLEDEMNAVRRIVREQQFKVGAGILSGRMQTQAASKALTALADSAVERLLYAARKDVERRLPCPGGDMAVLAMGKMGGSEMSVTSDLDIMVLYDPAGADPAAAHVYYTKVTQRLISALSAPTQEGGLYEVDMALRPSGSAGPITVSMMALSGYYQTQAWTWEFMALTRARVSRASSQVFADKVTSVITAILTAPRDTAVTQADVLDMRRRLERDKGPRGEWDIKRVPGGMVDIEFIAQYLQLITGPDNAAVLQVSTADALNSAASAGALPPQQNEILQEALMLYALMTAYLAVAVEGFFDPVKAPKVVARRLSELCKVADFSALETRYHESRKAVRQVFESVVGPV